MIPVPESFFPTIREQLWPLFDLAGRRHRIDPALLIAVGWIESGCDPMAVSPAGAVGLMQMWPATAAEVAGQLGVASWDLTRPQTAIDFGAFYLARQLARFEQPRLAIAAYHAGPTAVAAAGNQVPASIPLRRYVQDVMAAWELFRKSLPTILAAAPQAASAADDWRLVAPPDNYQQQPVPVPAAAVPVLEALAERLGLVFHRDDSLRKVYVGLPRPHLVPTPARKGGLVVPVPGATWAANADCTVDGVGLDLIVPLGSPVVAAAAGQVVYSSARTGGLHPSDTYGEVQIAIDRPFSCGRKAFPLTVYRNLARLRFNVPEGTRVPHVHVIQGELLGWSGRGGGLPRLVFSVVERAGRDGLSTSQQGLSPAQLSACLGLLTGGARR